MSEAEPELGLGTVVGAESGRVRVRFPASQEERQYAADQAPLRRVAFRPGDQVAAADGGTWEIAEVQEVDGLLVYRDAAGRALPEAKLSDSLMGGSPLDRLIHGQFDSHEAFELRVEALQHQHRRRQSPIRGFVGGRMDLIPHQLYIAREVTRRHAPRVLLADEVGLGKTVEACLIVHRLLATGRAARVLIVVPDSLVHQWFVELLRRFHLWFHIFDEERCAAIQAVHPEANPFLDDQLVLCGLPLLLNQRRAAQAVAAGWDVLVVDEAHHLGWTPEAPSAEYRAIEALSRCSEGLLLLTATPEQLGLASHFARLRLLDPDRFHDLARFEEESRHYGELASVVNGILEGGSLGAEGERTLDSVLRDEPPEVRRRFFDEARGGGEARHKCVADLLDRHGPGRVMFRNTRAAVRGFPRRLPLPAPLAAPSPEEGLLERLADEFEADLQAPGPRRAFDLRNDPRVVWLAEWLRRSGGAKVLLICRSREKVLALDEALRSHITVDTAVFHEGLDLVQRDRNAAWFAEPDGAQILLASEIGSEGRNFQFAHHLVLFDLPLDPELIEQRIGRLDRIGQKSEVRIHIPFVLGSPQEVLFRWFHEGLDAFGHHLIAGRELREEFAAAVRDLAQDFHETHAARGGDLEELVVRTRDRRRELEDQLERGRDRLLELNSCRTEVARGVAESISCLDEEAGLEGFLLRVWDHHGVRVEELASRTYKLGSAGVFADTFPGLPPGGWVATLDRARALSREDLVFLTWDHPMVTGALDLLLGGGEGSCAVAVMPGGTERSLGLELVHVLECVAPARWHADRFLPATPIRVWVDARGQEMTLPARTPLVGVPKVGSPVHRMLEHPAIRGLLPELVAAGQELAEARRRPIIASALKAVREELGHEEERLRALAAINPNVRPAEIEAMGEQRRSLEVSIAQARLRLDSVRVIVRGG